AALQSILLLVLGLVWPKLNLGAATSRIAFWLFIYAAFAILAAFVIAAIWGAGNETMPLAAGTAHGTAFQEAVIRAVPYSSPLLPRVLSPLRSFLAGFALSNHNP